MALFQYSARNVTITLKAMSPDPQAQILGTHTVSGYGADAFLSVELSDDDFTTVEGADGQVVRSYKCNNLGEATLTLQQTSPSNLKLLRYRELDKALMGAGVFNMTVSVPPVKSGIVNNGFATGVILSATAYVKKVANLEFGKESGERAWTLTLVNPKLDTGLVELIATGADIVSDIVGIGSLIQ